MKQPLSVTLIFPLSPCIIVIDTFAGDQSPYSIMIDTLAADHHGQAKPIRV